MSFKDRTTEFNAIADRIRSRSKNQSALERRSLLSSPKFDASSNTKKRHPQSEFSLMAAEISRNITSTAGKLEKLTKCSHQACFKSAWTDPCMHFLCSGETKDAF